jgi:hypothetical protein
VDTATVWYDHRADGTNHGIFKLLAASGPVTENESPNLIMQWTNVAALWVHSYDMRKVRP